MERERERERERGLFVLGGLRLKKGTRVAHPRKYPEACPRNRPPKWQVKWLMMPRNIPTKHTLIPTPVAPAHPPPPLSDKPKKYI